MKELLKETNQQKHLFRSYYCSTCKQIKPCGVLTSGNYCCQCYFQNEKEKAQEYSDYQQVYQQKRKEQKERFQQLGLLKDYLGCPKCGSKEIDAYSLYENNRLICQPCLIKKEGGSSGAVSFSERQKWYKRYWGINLTEWLTNYQCLPVNAGCAKEWLKDKGHLKNCKCLERETQNLVELFTSSLKEMEEKLNKCKCEKSEKVRVSSDFYAWCERCERRIKVASKKRVIKNRNDPKFWGLEVKEKVLCLECLEKFQKEMPQRKQYLLAEYQKRYVKK